MSKVFAKKESNVHDTKIINTKIKEQYDYKNYIATNLFIGDTLKPPCNTSLRIGNKHPKKHRPSSKFTLVNNNF